MSKKKTHEEYVEEVKVKNPNIEVLGQYNGAKIKIQHRCIKHNIYWNTSPTNILQGQGCEMCRIEKIRNYHLKDARKYLEEVNNINPNIIVLEQYINSSTPILHRCKVHGIEWKIAPSNILQGQGCFKCGNEKISNKLRITHNQYTKKVNDICPNIIVKEKYINGTTPILHECLIDNYEWKIYPKYILNGTGCPKCSNRIRRNHDEYVKEVALINPNITVLENFVNTTTKILHKCNIHNVEWKSTPDSILSGHSCYLCGYEKIGIKNSKTHDEYVKELNKINKDVIVLDTYINSLTPILHKCLIDDNEWNVSPANILTGYGCPKCKESKGEKRITTWLKNNNINFISQKKFNDCIDIKPLPFDFYLPYYNLCIEYDGEQHFKPIDFFGGQESYEYTQRHDKIKDEYCKNNNIKLLRIPYFKNIEEELNNFLFI